MTPGGQPFFFPRHIHSTPLGPLRLADFEKISELYSLNLRLYQQGTATPNAFREVCRKTKLITGGYWRLLALYLPEVFTRSTTSHFTHLLPIF